MFSCPKTLSNPYGSSHFDQNDTSHEVCKGVLDTKNRDFRSFSAILGYFRVLSNPAFPPKLGLKLRAILEKSINRGKARRTRFFTLARVDFDNFRLGRDLLRSARSFLNKTAFCLRHVAIDAVNSNPQTVKTSED